MSDKNEITLAADTHPVTDSRAPTMCANCGAERRDAFCPVCGQPALPRLTTAFLARRAADLFDLDRGVIGTTAALFVRPGIVIRDYLRGRTVPYTNPVKHFALVISLVQLIALAAGVTAAAAEGIAAGGEMGAGATGVAQIINRFFVLLAAPAVPILAWIQQRVFRRSRLTYGEHLVFALFVAAQQLLILLPAFALTNSGRVVSDASAILSLTASIAYYAWVAKTVFGETTGGAIWRSVATLLSTSLAYSLLLGLALTVLAGLT